MTSDSDARAWRAHHGRPVSPAAVLAGLTVGSIPAAAEATARLWPEREVLRVGAEAITFRDLVEKSRRLGNWLIGQRVRPGDRVLLAGPNAVSYAIGYLAILNVGATVVLVNPMLTERELAVLVEDADPVAGLAAGLRVEQLRALVPAPILDLDDLTEVLTSARADPIPPPAPSAVAHLAFTSGTTGRPKPTPLTHANVLASARSIMIAWRWSADDVLVHALPLQHGHGLSGLHVAMLSGSRTVVLARFDPDELVRELAGRAATALFAVPTMYERLLETSHLSDRAVRTLRVATSGSAALPSATSDRVLERTGWRPLERYGLTETGYVTSNLFDDRRAGTVGCALPGAEVRIADDGGIVRPAGEDGEIQLRGAQVFAGYTTPAAGTFTADGWFRTGDLGFVDPQSGFVTINGRSKQLIVSGGLNVYPREVEMVLAEAPSVREVAVAGRPSVEWGEQVVAFVVPAPGAAFDPQALRDHAATRLAAYKQPKAYLQMEALPRNHLGKIVYDQLPS